MSPLPFISPGDAEVVIPFEAAEGRIVPGGKMISLIRRASILMDPVGAHIGLPDVSHDDVQALSGFAKAYSHPSREARTKRRQRLTSRRNVSSRQ